MDKTENKNLNLPGYSDPVDIEKINDNFRILDSETLFRSGGSLTGDINANGYTISGVKQPELDNDVTSKLYVDTKVKTVSEDAGKQKTALKSVTVTLLAAGWVGTDTLTQTAAVEGMTASWKAGMPVLEPEETKEADMLARKAFACVSRIDTAEGAITFTCYKDKPEADFTVTIPGILV